MRTAVREQDLHKCTTATVYLTQRIHARLKSHMTCAITTTSPLLPDQYPSSPFHLLSPGSILAECEKAPRQTSLSLRLCKHEQISLPLVFYFVIDRYNFHFTKKFIASNTRLLVECRWPKYVDMVP